MQSSGGGLHQRVPFRTHSAQDKSVEQPWLLAGLVLFPPVPTRHPPSPFPFEPHPALLAAGFRPLSGAEAEALLNAFPPAPADTGAATPALTPDLHAPPPNRSRAPITSDEGDLGSDPYDERPDDPAPSEPIQADRFDLGPDPYDDFGDVAASPAPVSEPIDLGPDLYDDVTTDLDDSAPQMMAKIGEPIHLGPSDLDDPAPSEPIHERIILGPIAAQGFDPVDEAYRDDPEPEVVKIGEPIDLGPTDLYDPDDPDDPTLQKEVITFNVPFDDVAASPAPAPIDLVWDEFSSTATTLVPHPRGYDPKLSLELAHAPLIPAFPTQLFAGRDILIENPDAVEFVRHSIRRRVRRPGLGAL